VIRALTGASSGADRAELGHRLSGFIYGTIVALSVLVGGARAYPHSPGHIAVLVGVTCVVFWLAHVYAHAIGHAVARQERLTLGEIGTFARNEAALVEAALAPVVALLLGAAGVISGQASVWLAFAFGMVVLGVEGLVFARMERLGFLGTLLVVGLNLSLGLVLVALKILVGHH
jgi:hypothetical protein